MLWWTPHPCPVSRPNRIPKHLLGPKPPQAPIPQPRRRPSGPGRIQQPQPPPAPQRFCPPHQPPSPPQEPPPPSTDPWTQFAPPCSPRTTSRIPSKTNLLKGSRLSRRCPFPKKNGAPQHPPPIASG